MEGKTTPAWKTQGLADRTKNKYTNPLLLSILNLPGIREAVHASLLQYDKVLKSGSSSPDDKGKYACLNALLSLMVASASSIDDATTAAHACMKEFSETSLHRKYAGINNNYTPVEIDSIFHRLVDYLSPSPFSEVFCIKFGFFKSELHRWHFSVPRLSDFDARLCHPRYTSQDENQKGRGFPNTAVFIGRGENGDPYQATPFRCSKAPLRFPIWSKGALWGDDVRFPDAWSDWYQLVGIISGDQQASSATLLMENNVWRCYDKNGSAPRVSKPEDTMPSVLIFSKIRVSREKKAGYIDYTRKRMLGAAKWYNRAVTANSLKPEDGRYLDFDEDRWEEGLKGKVFDPPDFL